ncbi:MAG: tryptophan 7-halogenase [Gemmatimonadota bacterium]
MPEFMAMTCDVLIIGGGPAGAAAARLLASWGHDVMVVNRPSPQAALAESIPPSTRKLLHRIGIADAVDRAAFIRSTGNTVYWGGERRIASFADGEYGYQVERAGFDALCLRLAEVAGARVLHNATVRSVRTGTAHVVRVSSESSEEEVQAQWVLDCSGRAGVLARAHRRSQPGRTLALVATWERSGGWSVPDESHTLVESYEAGWAWSVPVSETRRCIAFMVDPTLTDVPGRAQLSAQYQAELNNTMQLSRLVQDATLVTAPWACEASQYDAERASGDGYLLVGDAASFVDPLSSFGVKKALASAWLASVVTHTALTQPELRVHASNLYEARERSMFAALQRQSAELARAATSTHAHAFWSERSESDSTESSAEPDLDALRRDRDLLRAFERLKQQDSIRLRPGDAVRRVELPVVRDNRVALATHLVSPEYPEGIRYVRAIDLVTLADLAVEHRQVPDLYDAYQRVAPPAALPDLLGALSLLIAKGLLQHA